MVIYQIFLTKARSYDVSPGFLFVAEKAVLVDFDAYRPQIEEVKLQIADLEAQIEDTKDDEEASDNPNNELPDDELDLNPDEKTIEEDLIA